MKKVTAFTSITLASISVGFITLFISLIADSQLQISDIALLALGIPLNVVLFLLISLPVINLLRQLTASLTAINQDREGPRIDGLPLGLLGGLVDEANTLIRNQGEFQQARGRLYEQISEVAAQEERKRLARDLHDSIKQQIFSINISSAAAHAHLDNNPAAARAALVDVKQSAQEAMVEMRALLQQLAPAPLEKSGLIEALREQAEALSYRTGAKVETNFGTLPNDETFPIGTQETLFRIAQEALSNIARHARAQNVTIELGQAENQLITLQIMDDGQGFDIGKIKRGMGLGNIERRVQEIDGAIFAMDSVVNQGTHLRIEIPPYDETVDESVQKEREAEYQKQYNNTVKYYWGFIGSFTVALFMLSLVLRVLIQQSSVLIFGFAVISGLIALPVIGWTLRRYLNNRSIFFESVPYQHSLTYFLKNRSHQGDWIVWFCLLQFFVPLLIILPENNYVLVTTIAIIGLTLMTFHLAIVARMRYLELKTVNAVVREEKLKEFLSSILYGWLTVGILVVVFSLPNVLNLEVEPLFQLPFTTVDQWQQFLFFSMIVMYFVYHIVVSYFYWNHQRQERTVA